MIVQLQEVLRSAVGAVRDSAPAESWTRRLRKPRVESLEGRAMCDGDVLVNNGGTVSTVTYGGGS